MTGRTGADRTFEELRGLIFDMLLITDGRTTELLETILQERLGVSVLRQEQADEAADTERGGTAYVRESVLVGEQSRLPVSHNVALVDARYVPGELFQTIARKKQGIGKAISAAGLRTLREVLESGSVGAADAIDLFGQPLKLSFPDTDEKIPYKKYAIYFQTEPGILLLEYYNPKLVHYRLEKTEKSG